MMQCKGFSNPEGTWVGWRVGWIHTNCFIALPLKLSTDLGFKIIMLIGKRSSNACLYIQKSIKSRSEMSSFIVPYRALKHLTSLHIHFKRIPILTLVFFLKRLDNLFKHFFSLNFVRIRWAELQVSPGSGRFNPTSNAPRHTIKQYSMQSVCKVFLLTCSTTIFASDSWCRDPNRFCKYSAAHHIQ